YSATGAAGHADPKIPLLPARPSPRIQISQRNVHPLPQSRYSMSAPSQNAPGWPGSPPRWTSSAKSGVGTARNTASRVWFTLSHGIFDEIYYPRVDQACVRDLGLIVTDGASFFSEEKRDTRWEVAYLAPGVPAYRLTNTCSQGRYRIEKDIVSDPRRE